MFHNVKEEALVVPLRVPQPSRIYWISLNKRDVKCFISQHQLYTHS